MYTGTGIDKNLCPASDLEWLETNGLGDYATATGQCNNTRRYHGLLVANIPGLDRHVLLSTLEDWLVRDQETAALSSRFHPGCTYPEGHKNLVGFTAAPCPTFVYEAAGFRITRSIALLHASLGTGHTVLVRYTIKALTEQAKEQGAMLRIAPLLAYRFHHALTHANMDLQVKTYPANSGFKIQPYNTLPPLCLQVEGLFDFWPSPEWIHDVEYPIEQARGFEYKEDLFSPGLLEVHVLDGDDIILSASTQEIAQGSAQTPNLRALWDKEMARRAACETGTSLQEAAALLGASCENADEASEKELDNGQRIRKESPLLAFLAAQSRDFLMTTASGKNLLLAGFPWFGSWGRDTLIALPGATFLAGRIKEGLAILQTLAENARDGLVPNTFDGDGRASGYNSADASLWFAWDCQLMLETLQKSRNKPGGKEVLAAFQDLCAPAIYSIIAAYRDGRVPFVRVATSGLLEVGTPDTQLTWMDAQVDGRPVTPRNGFPVEIQALWYNTLAFAHNLAKKRGDPDPCPAARLKAIKAVFAACFCLPDNTLHDVWRPREDGGPDASLRPNQLLAVSLPEPVAPRECFGPIVAAVTDKLLTPFGLRTLSPDDPAFHPVYGGGIAARDGAYHQGTVWTWLLGPYTDALLKSLSLEEEGGEKAEKSDKADKADKKSKKKLAQELEKYLATITPLLTTHLQQACVGHMSEIFSATAPYAPDGAVAQAWSEAEVYRSLLALRKADKDVFKSWEQDLKIFQD